MDCKRSQFNNLRGKINVQWWARGRGEGGPEEEKRDTIKADFIFKIPLYFGGYESERDKSEDRKAAEMLSS